MRPNGNSEVSESDNCLITGAAGGMGQALCRLLAEEGWHITAVDRNQKRLEQLQDTIGSDIRIALLDLSSPECGGKVKELLNQQQCKLHGVVNLAGVSRGNTIDELDVADWEYSFQVNVKAPMLIVQAALPFFVDNRSSIVNVGSPAGIAGARKPSYASSKGSLHGLTMSLARNLGPRGIRVNTVLPGPTITRMTNDWDIEKRSAIAKQCFLQRLSEPREIAAPISFLLSESSSFVTGSVLDVTGGSLYSH